MTLRIIAEQCYDDCVIYAECFLCWSTYKPFMLSVVMLNVVAPVQATSVLIKNVLLLYHFLHPSSQQQMHLGNKHDVDKVIVLPQ